MGEYKFKNSAITQSAIGDKPKVIVENNDFEKLQNELQQLLLHYRYNFKNDKKTINILETAVSEINNPPKLNECLKKLPNEIFLIAKKLCLNVITAAILKAYGG